MPLQLILTPVASEISCQSLHILRNLHFITSRLGSTTFSQHNFVQLTTIDILVSSPPSALAFLEEIRPTHLGQIPLHALDRSLDLFFLNTAEHFTLVLPPEANDTLLVAAASPYLLAAGMDHLLEAFEAAHSVMLAVFSAPQSVELAGRYVPGYTDALFSVRRCNACVTKSNRQN